MYCIFTYIHSHAHHENVPMLSHLGPNNMNHKTHPSSPIFFWVYDVISTAATCLRIELTSFSCPDNWTIFPEFTKWFPERYFWVRILRHRAVCLSVWPSGAKMVFPVRDASLDVDKALRCSSVSFVPGYRKIDRRQQVLAGDILITDWQLSLWENYGILVDQICSCMPWLKSYLII